MKITKEQAEIIIEVFEDHVEALSELEQGSLFGEAWEVLEKLKQFVDEN